MTTVVLGWDGLDADLLEEYSLAHKFGEHVRRIETVTNPTLETPHTRELWPTLITGQHPREHGIRAASESDSLSWDNPLVDTASTIASHCLPHSVRTVIGRHMRNRGADLRDLDPDDYAERGLTTVFDDRSHVALSIPNYHTEITEQLELGGSRKATFREFIEVTESGGIRERDDCDIGRLEQRLWSAASQKLGAVRAAIARDYDLVWVWLGFIDTVGHLDPGMSESLQARGYEQSAAWTEQIRDSLGSDDELVCVSDHGLQNGHHTKHAVITSDTVDVVKPVDSVMDVREGIDRITPTSGSDSVDIPPVTDTQRPSDATRSVTSIEDQLSDLGYI